jgi:hypothetical protein
MMRSHTHGLWAFALPCALITACSTAGEGGTGAGITSGPVLPVPTGDYDGADGTATDGEPPLGPEGYDYCRLRPDSITPFMGWQIACSATSANRQFANPLDDSFIQIEDVSDHFGNICCGGSSTASEADADCQQLCMEQICEAARIQHVAWAVDVSNDGMGGDCLDVSESCGFDVELCESGALHEQFGGPGELFSYVLQAECEAEHDQGISPYDDERPYWDWVQHPNDPSDDPPVCAPTPTPDPGLPESVPENEVGEEPGTSVTLQWSIAGGPIDREQSLDADVHLAYAVNPCASGDCIGLSALHVTVPDGNYRGFALENVHLVLEHAPPDAPLSASGAFSLGSRTLAATLSLAVDGVPLVITGFNEGHVDGVALPRSDTMTLTNLVFEFDDGMIDAALELNINGSYVRHPPDALIKVVDAPIDCAMPVTFEAASSDLDGDFLTHMWWVPPWFLGTGNLLDAKLPPGSYRVYLTSFDSTGKFDSTALRHVRSCR